MEKTAGFCDVVVGLDFFGGVFGLTFFGESAAECEYAANFTDVKFPHFQNLTAGYSFFTLPFICLYSSLFYKYHLGSYKTVRF